MENNLSCPVDHITVHETRVRLTALLVFLTALLYILTGYWWIALLVDRAPKLFAARLGFIFSDGLLIAAIFESKGAAYCIDAVLLLFSFLESAVGFCAGCYVYSFLKRFFPRSVA